MATIGSSSHAQKTLRLEQLRQHFEQQRQRQQPRKKRGVVCRCTVSLAQSEQVQIASQKAGRCVSAAL